jgi:hypothetical protein
MTFAKILLASLLIPASSFACGGQMEETQETQQELLISISRKPLNCELNGVQSEGLLETWAIYRCLGSPVRGELTAFGEKQMAVLSIRKEDTKYFMETEKSDAAIVCEVKI